MRQNLESVGVGTEVELFPGILVSLTKKDAQVESWADDKTFAHQC